jgi:hypothetical protein
VSLGRRISGRTLVPSVGYSCYRPLDEQHYARSVHGIYAADPGKSSHGGDWAGPPTGWAKVDAAAIDYSNYISVFGSEEAFFAACREVGLVPKGIWPPAFPREAWHVIDLDNPYGPVPAGLDVTEFEEDIDMDVIQADGRGFAVVGPGYFRSLTASEGAAMTRQWKARGVSAADFDLIRSACTAGDVNYMPPVRTPFVATDVWGHQIVGPGGGHAANFLQQTRDAVLGIRADGVQATVDYSKIVAGVVEGVSAALPDDVTFDEAAVVKAVRAAIDGATIRVSPDGEQQ